MAKAMRFSQKNIEAIRPPEGVKGRTVKDTYRDATTPGLWLTVYSTGRKVFSYVARVGGRVGRFTVGKWPDLTVEAARLAVKKLAGEIARGGNPMADRNRTRQEATLGEVFAAYLAHAQGRLKSWRAYEEVYLRYLSAWKTRRISTIRRGDVAALHAQVGRDKGRYAANRLLALVSIVWNFARNDLEIPVENAARGVKRFKEESRDRFLRADELRRFFAACEETEEPWGDFFRVLLLTGARKSNVMGMKWTDVELDRGLWRIPGEVSKNGEVLVVILVPAALEILRARHEARKDEAAFVFPSHGATGHLAHTQKAWDRIVKAADLEKVRVHDLRRTLGSWAALTGASLPMVGKMLGHRSTAATAVYARLDVEGTRQVVNTAADAILEAANGGPPVLKQLPAKAGDEPQDDDTTDDGQEARKDR